MVRSAHEFACMEAQQAGTLVVISSVAGDRSRRRTNYLYRAAKGLVDRLLEGVSHRLYGSSVHAMLVKPGPTRTPMTAGLGIPAARLATPEQVASCIVRGITRRRAVVYAPQMACHYAGYSPSSRIYFQPVVDLRMPLMQFGPLPAQNTVEVLTCGVAMCTCNAGAFLQPQLDSIAAQTRPPAHVVISDDRSDDGTWERLRAWSDAMSTRTNMRVTLIRNEQRLGVTRNFEQATSHLETDIIFLADQDDIWTETKIERMAAVFDENPNVLLAHSNARLIDERGVDLGKSLFQALRLSTSEWELARQKRFFEVYCRRNLVTGTTAAFRHALLKLALPFPEDWIHDEWLAVCAAAAGEVIMLEDKLTDYRQHGTNAIGVPLTELSRLVTYAIKVAKMPRAEHLQYKIRRLDALLRRLRSCAGISAEKLGLVEEARAHFVRRTQFDGSLPHRVLSVFRESRSRGYRRFADGVAGMVRDLIHF